MESTPRYETLNTIATGEFAVVYRARDRELGREVAIKQIHQQYLNDPRQLERYWREAQLLASLQHPNILTVYDIARPKGWLILELMVGSLQRSVENGPMDLDLLRVVLGCSANALHFLHTNGIIHGDVKPSNMLVDAQGRVKLGDFGLARRASNEQGSLLKGTTKYMAPELVSDQFGTVGPASDLYSLGFSAYELLCGPDFETLFPSLATFGRDRQIAWLMWHVAADRHLPEVARVLEGVPEDLARIINRLVAKDQSRRYQSALEVLQDLRAGRTTVATAAAPVETAPPTDRRRVLRRAAAIAAICCSLLLCIVLLLPSQPAALPPKETPPVEGVVRLIDPDRRVLVLETAQDGGKVELALRPGDKFFINSKESIFRELQPSDRAVIEYVYDESGQKLALVKVTRPETQEGRIKTLEADSGRFTLAYGPRDEQLVIRVPATAKLLFNDDEKIQGKPVALADLRVGDRIVVKHVGEESGRAAIELAAQREVTFQGTIREVNAAAGQVKIDQGDGPRVKSVTLSVALNCEVTLNDRRVLDQRTLTLADVKPGDKATITHDTRVVRIDAYRALGQAGVIQNVQRNLLEVLLEGQTRPKNFMIEAGCKVTLGGEPAEMDDLRSGDLVDVMHDSPSPSAPSSRALSIAARRPSEQNRWALLIGIQNYDDAALRTVLTALEDVRILQDALVKRAGVPANQALALADVSQVRLKGAVSSLLERIQPDGNVVVYYAGHAFRDHDGQVYLAPKEFNREQAAATGLSLAWLVERLEACPTREKLLLLDACHAGAGINPQNEPSTAEMFAGLKGPNGQAALRTVTGIASCSEGQRGYVLPQQKHSLFAYSVSQGFLGRADRNRDNRFEPTEVFSFLTESMAASTGSLPGPQTPKLFLPDNRPPRLSDDARKALREFAALTRQGSVKPADAKAKYTAVQGLAEKEPEPDLLYGLVLLKLRQRDEALASLGKVLAARPELLLPSQAMAWLRFEKRDFANGVKNLTDLVQKTPRPKKQDDALPPEWLERFRWAGQLREFAAAMDERRAVSPEAFEKLDAAAAERSKAALEAYENGREQTRKLIANFDDRLAKASDEAAKAKLTIDRRQVASYAAFPLDRAIEEILAGLDR